MARLLKQGDVIMLIASCNKQITDPELKDSNQIVGHKDGNNNFSLDKMKQGLKGIEIDIKNYRKQYQFDNKNQKFQIRSSKANGLQYKKNILNQIAQLFRLGKRRVYLIYTGHGHENGDWKIETFQNQDGDRITLYQIIQLWNKNKNKQALLNIFMDSCYSGQWCYRIVQKQKINSISIFASSNYNEISRASSKGGYLCQILFAQNAGIQSILEILSNFNQHPQFIINGQSFVKKPTLKDYKLLAKSLFNGNNIIGQPIDYDSFDWWIDQKPFQLENKNKQRKEKKQFESTYTQKNGDIYNGAWKKRANQDNVQQWVKQGQGKMKYANGQIYEGDWKNNVRHGQGTLQFVNDEGKPAGFYKGRWQNDLPNGQGTHFYSSDKTYRYEGRWINAQRQEGKLFYNNQEVTFKGEE